MIRFKLILLLLAALAIGGCGQTKDAAEPAALARGHLCFAMPASGAALLTAAAFPC